MNSSATTGAVYIRLAIRFALIILTGLFAVFLLPKLLQVFFPFLLALVFASLLNPIVNVINGAFNKHTEKHSQTRRIVSLALNIFIVLLLSVGLFFATARIIKELVSFTQSIQQNWTAVTDRLANLEEYMAWLRELLPIGADEFFARLNTTLLQALEDGAQMFLSGTVTLAATFISGAGVFFLSMVVFFLAMFFLISDYHVLTDFLAKHENNRVLEGLQTLRDSIWSVLGGYFRAQFIMAFIAFVYMLVGLKIYGLKHAFIVALLLGLIDLLPFIGTIAFLVPWGVIELISGDTRSGIYLLVLGISFFLIRKVIEPKVMGSQTGLHPLLVLLSGYVGLQFSGVWGAILGPMVLVLFITLFKTGILDSTLADGAEVVARINAFLTRDDQQPLSETDFQSKD